MSLRLLFSMLCLVAPLGALAAQEKVDCTRDTLSIPEQDRQGLHELSLGHVVPEIAIGRFAKMECIEQALRSSRDEGWQIEMTTASIIDRIWNDEGWEQTYLISVPMLKPGQQPWETRSQIRRFYYIQGWHNERSVELETGKTASENGPCG